MQKNKLKLLALTPPPTDPKERQAWIASLAEKTDRLIAALRDEYPGRH